MKLMLFLTVIYLLIYRLVSVCLSGSKFIARVCPFLTCEQFLQRYKGLIRPVSSTVNMWGGLTSPHLLNTVESKAYCLIISTTDTSSMPFMSLHINIAHLSLFYRHYFGQCSVELASFMPLTKSWHQAGVCIAQFLC